MPPPQRSNIGRLRAVAGLLVELEREITELSNTNADLKAEADQRERELTELRDQYDRLTEENQGLERLVAQLRSEHVRAFRDVSTADDLGHQELASRLRTFFDQDLPALIRPLIRSEYLTGAERAGRQAELIAQVCRILFSGGPVECGALLDGLKEATTQHAPNESLVNSAEPVCSIAQEIRRRAAELDNPDGLFFDCAVGEVIDPAVQKQWDGCDEQAPIDFVVTPGYRAKGKIYRLQEVFTQV